MVGFAFRPLATFFLSLVLSLSAATAAGGRSLSPRHSRLQAIDQPALIVVHASYEFDTKGAAREAIDAQIRHFKSRGLPVIYLVSDPSENGLKNWYTEDRAPDYLIYSAGGEHNLPLRNPDVTVVGGFFGNYDTHNGCHTQALRNVVDSYFRLQGRSVPLTVHLPVSSIYFWEDDSILREKILARMQNPNEWMREISGILFSREFSNDGEMELGRAFFYKTKKPEFIQNPFLDVVVPGSHYSAEEDADNPLSFVSREGRAVARDGRYQEADSVNFQSYQFALSNSSASGLLRFGKGLRKVQFVFSAQ
jgi:hypothetical protein